MYYLHNFGSNQRFQIKTVLRQTASHLLWENLNCSTMTSFQHIFWEHMPCCFKNWIKNYLNSKCLASDFLLVKLILVWIALVTTSIKTLNITFRNSQSQHRRKHEILEGGKQRREVNIRRTKNKQNLFAKQHIKSSLINVKYENVEDGKSSNW